MKKAIWWVIGIIVVAAIVIAVSLNNKPTEAKTIKIGLSLPLTGDVAFIGEAVKNAALLATDDVNSDKSLKNKYELIMEDDSFDARKGATTLSKLINVDKVDALISIGSTVGNVATPLATAAKIPHISVAGDQNIAKGDFNFLNWTRPQQEVDTLIKELTRRNITKLAVIGVNQEGFKAIEKDLIEKLAATNITIVGNETFNPGQTDFRTIISKLQKTNPQVYLLDSFDPEIGIIGKQIHDLGIKTPLISIESFGLTSDPTLFEGDWYVDAAVPTSAFSIAYEKKYGKPVGPAAPNAYDAIKLLVNAFEAVKGDVTGEKVAQALNSETTYVGAMGALKPGPEGAFMSEASVKIIKNGKPELLMTP